MPIIMLWQRRLSAIGKIPSSFYERPLTFHKTIGFAWKYIHTDSWRGYAGLAKKDDQHEMTILVKRKESVTELLTRVDHVVGLLKKWFASTPHGGLSHELLDDDLSGGLVTKWGDDDV